MPHALLLSVRFHDDRYHGRPEWPPSPARLFQALVAGVASGRHLSAEDRAALVWLEQLTAPVIAAPVKRDGRGFTNYVPNNDLDAVGGDPRRISEIRAGKLVRPLLFNSAVDLVYAWPFDDDRSHAQRLCALAERLYQLGRGVDMAWAWGEIVAADEVETRLAQRGRAIYRPGAGEGGIVLASPQSGSLASLERRFVELGGRFRSIKGGRQQIYSQASRPHFVPVTYASPPQHLLFELRELTDEQRLGVWPLTRAVALVEHLRDQAAARLKQRRTTNEGLVDRILIGRDATQADKAARIRIVPLPSIGSRHVVPAIRRILIELPPNCPFSAVEIADVFSGALVAEHVDPETGEVIETRLLPAEERAMLRHYGVDADDDTSYRVWRSVTPVALPEGAARRRIDPHRLAQELAAARENPDARQKEAKSGTERHNEQNRAAAALVQSLRHAGLSQPPETLRLQREPFAARGARVEEFAAGTRFAEERLWHVELTFSEPLAGPLVIGDGRYLGLGLMAPEREALRDVAMYALPTDARIACADGPALTHAARRALMALARDVDDKVPPLFSGHGEDGGRAASGQHHHIFIAADDTDGDGFVDRLIVAAPWACDLSTRPGRGERERFDATMSKLETLRAGRLGVIALAGPNAPAEHDTIIGPAQLWESRTLYLATRHAGRRKDATAALIGDLTAECARRSLPQPAEIEIVCSNGLPNGGGLAAHARLRFATAIRGPIMLGRNSHQGGGLFAARE
ncbi:type I-G CRISPR-associated protein Csb2 [Bradyrhizobium oligotrophicum]|uniref:type I-G CRISPR-associated protein Csb2 n=1 Tax=Bradyrhizobium oligotrophicum TaxID=44255 RepID=UPI003EBB37AE